MKQRKNHFWSLLTGIAISLAGCSSPVESDVPGSPDAGVTPTPDAAPLPLSPNRPNRLELDDDGCHGIYAQSVVPTFHLELDAEVLAQLQAEWVASEDADPRPEYPVAKFRWEDVEITNASIRLRGNPTYWYDDGKMQLQISFNAYADKGRFLGLRKLIFDAASANESFLRDRLSLKFLREAGLPAPCANNARIYLNGEYYGLVTSIEKLDKEFLQRTFADDDGDLWKRGGWELKTNETTSNDDRLDAMRDAVTVEELAVYLDIPQAIRLWAADAILPNSDGPWAGGLNFYLYDDPTTGKFIHLPWDYDNVLTRLEPTVDPYTWHKEVRFHGRPFYALTVENPVDRSYFEQYLADIGDVLRSAYVPEVLQQRLMEWSAQIRPHLADDPNLPLDYVFPIDFDKRVEREIRFVADRHAFVATWLACWQSGGTDDGVGNCVE